MTVIYVIGRTSESNLFDIYLTQISEDSFYDNVQVQQFNIDFKHSSPQSNVITSWELGISANLRPKFKQELVSGLEGIKDLPFSIRNELVSSIANVIKRCPPPSKRVSIGVCAVVQLYTKEMERFFKMMSSVTSSSSRCFVMGEFETVKIEEGREKEDRCSVCLEEFSVGSEVAKLPCSHVFHGDCVRGWIEDRYTCPLCRSAPLLPI